MGGYGLAVYDSNSLGPRTGLLTRSFFTWRGDIKYYDGLRLTQLPGEMEILGNLLLKLSGIADDSRGHIDSVVNCPADRLGAAASRAKSASVSVSLSLAAAMEAYADKRGREY